MTEQDLHLQEVKSEQDLMVKENGTSGRPIYNLYYLGNSP